MPIRKTPRLTPKIQRAFTLLEIVLSLFFILAIVTILLTTSGTYVFSRGTNLASIAAKIASREIEALRNTDFDLLPLSGSLTDPDLGKLPSGTATRTLSNYQDDPKIKQVTIEVNWVFNGANKNLKIDTLIYENGL